MVFRQTRFRHPVSHLREEMDQLLSGFFGGLADGPPTDRGQPPVNAWETNDALMVEMEVPGVTTDRLDVSVVNHELTIVAKRPEVVEQDVTYHRRERSAGDWTRVLRLPIDVAPERVEARLQHGVLTVVLPKAESARPRKIPVTPGS
jgi:HSP20 family protein